VDVHLTEKDIFVPDMMVVCEREKIKYDGVYGAPDLVVEVLSPSTAKRDKGYKKDVYEKCGVREYWLVEPVGKSIEVYLLKDGDYVLDEVYTVYPEAHLESMSEEDRAAIPTKFKCSLYDDFEITLTDVFSGLLP
jgi:Uma2 family endonuclease